MVLLGSPEPPDFYNAVFGGNPQGRRYVAGSKKVESMVINSDSDLTSHP